MSSVMGMAADLFRGALALPEVLPALLPRLCCQVQLLETHFALEAFLQLLLLVLRLLRVRWLDFQPL